MPLQQFLKTALHRGAVEIAAEVQSHRLVERERSFCGDPRRGPDLALGLGRRRNLAYRRTGEGIEFSCAHVVKPSTRVGVARGADLCLANGRGPRGTLRGAGNGQGTKDTMKPMYFGNSARRLFGVYEAPASSSRDAGVVLCYPGEHEYNMTHWAFRRLSAMLAREGLHVLRFDWSCTGDSAGETSAGSMEAWLTDVGTAVRELRDVAGITSISLVGMRLGAALAALACTPELRIRELVLWEPVVDGGSYLSDLASVHETRRLQLLHPRAAFERDEVLGFRVRPDLRSALEGIDLRKAQPASRRIDVAVSEDTAAYRELRDALGGAGRTVRYLHVPEQTAAQRAAQREAALLSTGMLAAITETLAPRRS